MKRLWRSFAMVLERDHGRPPSDPGVVLEWFWKSPKRFWKGSKNVSDGSRIILEGFWSGSECSQENEN